MTTWEATQTRIVREAAELSPLKVLITILAAPFFLLGALIGFVWVLLMLVWQAVWVGVSQARETLKSPPKQA